MAAADDKFIFIDFGVKMLGISCEASASWQTIHNKHQTIFLFCFSRKKMSARIGMITNRHFTEKSSHFFFSEKEIKKFKLKYLQQSYVGTLWFKDIGKNLS